MLLCKTTNVFTKNTNNVWLENKQTDAILWNDIPQINKVFISFDTYIVRVVTHGTILFITVAK